jgi:hypothetical protein
MEYEKLLLTERDKVEEKLKAKDEEEERRKMEALEDDEDDDGDWEEDGDGEAGDDEGEEDTGAEAIEPLLRDPAAEVPVDERDDVDMNGVDMIDDAGDGEGGGLEPEDEDAPPVSKVPHVFLNKLALAQSRAMDATPSHPSAATDSLVNDDEREKTRDDEADKEPGCDDKVAEDFTPVPPPMNEREAAIQKEFEKEAALAKKLKGTLKWIERETN